ncbi:hypothetical protein LIER_33853 [Lithospermum erythrorhizon]|uniref:Pentatricopeptide repeat-containing protein n=1 Tax=Lithospermum erythrorhizon TaxID=34254 RepID=A0AAV3S0B9_LITER
MVHGNVLKNGFGENVFLQTGLINFYSRIGEIGNARLVFDEMSEPDSVAYNAFISGRSFNGLDQEALEVFKEMCVLSLRPNVSTLASVVPLCSRLENHWVGRCLHALAVKVGLLMDDHLVPALISMYSGFGELLIAVGIFGCVLDKNVTLFNAMLSAYAVHQKVFDAFNLFQHMLLDGVRPNMVTFVSIIPSIVSCGIIYNGESLHGTVIKFGYESQASVLTALLSMYSKLGDVESAEYIFRHMPNRNQLSWNSMISVYANNGLWHESLATFREMQLSGLVPDAISVITILLSCSELRALHLGKSTHTFSLKGRINEDTKVSNALMAFYSNCGYLESSFELFNIMVTKDTVTWNTLISGCVNNGEVDRALHIFYQMQKQGVNFDLVTLVSVLPSCGYPGKLADGMAIHAYTVKYGLIYDISLANALISMYFNCGELEAANIAFQEMPIRNVISWNALMTGYRYYDLQEDAMCLFKHMLKGNQKPNYVTLLNILPACCTNFQGMAIHAYSIKTSFEDEAPILTSLMLMYARFDNMKSCLALFYLGEGRNISLWNALITALVYSEDYRAAMHFFNQLLESEMNPDHVTILSLIPACLQLNDLQFSNSVLAYLVKKAFDRDIAILNSLIDMYAKCGNICFSKKLFDILPRKNALSWSAMINGYGLHGDGEAALDFLQKMKLSGFQPDDITYLSILSTCSHGCLAEQAMQVFTSMIHEGILPRMEHYACLIDLVSRTGCLNEAYHFIMSLPHIPPTNILESLLGACLTHGNIEVGEKIGRLLLEMSPENSTAYVILYNIYASSERWSDANTVRCKMEEQQLHKVPGFSMIDRNEYLPKWPS